MQWKIRSMHGIETSLAVFFTVLSVWCPLLLDGGVLQVQFVNLGTSVSPFRRGRKTKL